MSYLKPLRDANTQDIVTNVAECPHVNDNPHLKDSQPQNSLDNLPIPEDDTDPLPHGEEVPYFFSYEMLNAKIK